MKKLLLALIRFYKYFISPALPGGCKFTPTCSDYAQEALSVHGVRKGGYLTIRRLMRCTPFSRKMGFDPVPLKEEAEK